MYFIIIPHWIGAACRGNFALQKNDENVSQENNSNSGSNRKKREDYCKKIFVYAIPFAPYFK
jgi:hypothetical protein